jgi:hypothetical protein
MWSGESANGRPSPPATGQGRGELPLETYQRFQEVGSTKRALARQLFRESSTRDYAGAVEEAIEGYGTAKSCVSRHFKQTTAKQLQKFYTSRTFKYFPDMPRYLFIDRMNKKERKRTAPEIQSLQSANLV